MPLLESPTSSPEAVLKPYLDATLSLTTPPSPESLFSTYYIQNISPAPLSDTPLASGSNLLATVLITPPPLTLLPESSESAADNAEAIFHEAVRTLNSLQPGVEGADGLDGEIELFWPPINGDPEEEAEEW